MQKVFLATLCAWIPFCWQPLWGQAPGVGVKTSHEPKGQPKLSTAKTSDDKRGTKDIPLIVETHDRAKTDEETAEAKKDKDQADLVSRWTLRFTGIAAFCTAAAAIFTGLLVWVGWRGVRAANRTLEAIQRQANLMQDQFLDTQEANASNKTFAHGNLNALEAQGMLMARQIDLMQAPFDQWVDLDGWGSLRPQNNELRVAVNLVNSGTFPITLNYGYLRFGSFIDQRRMTKYNIGQHCCPVTVPGISANRL